MNLYFISLSNNAVLIDSVGLGNTWIECTTLAIIYSLNSGLCSLIAQAYGAEAYQLAGYYLHKGLIINFCFYISTSALWMFSGTIFRYLKYDLAVSENTSQYLYLMVPAMLCSLVFDTLKNFIQAHKVFSIPMYIQSCCTLVEVLTSYLAIISMDLGVRGLAYSRIFSEFNKAWTIFFYTKRSRRYQRSFFMFTRSSAHQLGQQIRFELTAGSIMFMEWMAYFFSTQMAAYLKVKEFAGYLISNQIINFLCMLPYALGVPLSSLVSNAIGEKNLSDVKTLIKVGLIMAILASLLISAIICLLAGSLANIFSEDDEIKTVVYHMLLIYAVLVLFDTLQNVLGGIGRSTGNEKLTSVIFIISYNAIGLPCSYILCYSFGLQAYGIRWGIGIAQFLNTIASIMLVKITDFASQVKKIQKLMNDETLPIPLDNSSQESSSA